MRDRRFATLDDFYKGPEGLIGIPNPAVHQGMKREHCQRANAAKSFTTSNYNITTSPSIEWEFVVDPIMVPIDHYPHAPRDRTQWRPGNAWKGEHGRKPIPLAELMAQEEVRMWAQRAGLTEDEVIGLRLYTGPSRSGEEALSKDVLALTGPLAL